MKYRILFEIDERLEAFNASVLAVALGTFNVEAERAIAMVQSRIARRDRMLAAYFRARRSFNQLKIEDKRLIIYRYKYRLSGQDIAKKLNTSLRTVWRKLQKLEEDDAYFETTGRTRDCKAQRNGKNGDTVHTTRAGVKVSTVPRAAREGTRERG